MTVYLVMFSLDLDKTDFGPLPGDYNTLVKVDSIYLNEGKAKEVCSIFNQREHRKGVKWYSCARSVVEAKPDKWPGTITTTPKVIAYWLTTHKRVLSNEGYQNLQNLGTDTIVGIDKLLAWSIAYPGGSE